MLYIYFKTFYIFIDECLNEIPCRNYIAKTVYRGPKSPVSVSYEKVQANRDRVYFSILINALPQKNS